MSRERTRRRESDDQEEKKSKSAGLRGRAGLDKVEEEMQAARERQNRTYAPFRYKAGYDLEKGKFNEFIMLDSSLADAFFFHEHSVQDENGNWGSKYEVCVKEFDNCPLCRLNEADPKKMGRSNYAMALSVLDLRPFKKKDGTVIKHARRLFVVKGEAMQKWIKTLEKAEKRLGTLRGAYFRPERLTKMESSVGNPAPLEGDFYEDYDDDHPNLDKLFSFVEEKDLEEEFGSDAKKGDNGKIIKQADEDITPFDYDGLFVLPDAEELSKKYSRKRNSDDDEDDRGWNSDSDEKPRRRSRRDADDESDEKPARRRSRDESEDEEEMPRARRRSRDDDEDEAPPPPRRTRQEAEEDSDDEAEPPKRRSRAKAEETDDDAEEEKPRVRTRQKAKPADDEDDEPEEKPKRSSRRRQADDDDDDSGPF